MYNTCVEFEGILETPTSNSKNKVKCVNSISIVLETPKSTNRKQKSNSIVLETPKSTNRKQKSKCITPLSVKLNRLARQNETGNTAPLTKNITPFFVRLEQLDFSTLKDLSGKHINNATKNKTPEQSKIDFITPISINLENKVIIDKPANRDIFKTSNSNNPFTNTNLGIQLDHLNTAEFKERHLDMSTTQKKTSLNTTPKVPTPKRIEPSTPQAHVQFSQELKIVLNQRNVLTSKTRKHVFDALDDLKRKDEDDSRKYKREKALLEIVNSEIKYVHQLEIIINFFLKPTREQKLLKNDDFQIVFGNIYPIYNINKELLEELEDSSTNVAKAFWRIAPFFKVYSVYACEFKNILNILQNARALNPQFAKFIENQESRPEVQSKLSALLITPIQRVPRYKLLLTQLLELTKSNEDDYDSLIECLEKIEEAADHINKNVEDQENMQRLLELQRFLKSGGPNVVKPGRILIKEGVLNKIATKDTSSEKFYIVLMNDILLFGKTKKKELKTNSLKCVSIFPLGKCKVLEILDKGCMKIICQNEEIILYHKQLSETQSWIEKIRECIENHLSDRKTLRKDSSSRRPVKRKDLFEYHEVGLSPGIPLKKRKMEPENVPVKSKFRITGRKPITRTPVDFEKSARNPSVSSNSSSTYNSSATDTTYIQVSNEIVPEKSSKEVYVFGKPHPNDASFKVTRVLSGVGNSLKKLFGFKN